MVVLWICLTILVLVAGLIALALFRSWRRDSGEEPPQIFGNHKIEILWTVLPFLLLVWVFYLTAKTMHSSDPQERRDPDLVVIGHQWWWEVRYPKSGIVTANEIHIPTGQHILLQLQSGDVIHSFWVPELGRKLDMIPGHPNYLWLEADRVGTYNGACSEYCGTQHAWMRFFVIAQPPDDFEAWEQARLKQPPVPTTGNPARGLSTFRERTCVNCHTVDGVSSTNSTAPDLTHLSARKTLAGGILENTPETLAEWLKNPQTIKPGSHMPDFHLTEAEIANLVAYFETLK